MGEVKSREGKNGNAPYWSAGSRIHVTQGTLRALEGTIVKRIGQRRFEIVFDSFPSGVTVRLQQNVLVVCQCRVY